LIFDAVDYLKTTKDMAQYLNAALDDGDPALFVAAIGDIAKAKGMMEISKKSGWRDGFRAIYCIIKYRFK